MSDVLTPVPAYSAPLAEESAGASSPIDGDKPRVPSTARNKPKASKKTAAGKVQGTADGGPVAGPSEPSSAQGASGGKAKGKGPAANGAKPTKSPRRPRKTLKQSTKVDKAVSTEDSDVPPFSFAEWQVLWSGPSSLFPAPAPWVDSGALDRCGKDLAAAGASLVPKGKAKSSARERRETEMMHPPREFAYDPASLMVYQGCKWDAKGFEAMELSAIPWLASMNAPNGKLRVVFPG